MLLFWALLILVGVVNFIANIHEDEEGIKFTQMFLNIVVIILISVLMFELDTKQNSNNYQQSQIELKQ